MFKRIKKKGFTLVELLIVLVFIIFVIAVFASAGHFIAKF